MWRGGFQREREGGVDAMIFWEEWDICNPFNFFLLGLNEKAWGKQAQ